MKIPGLATAVAAFDPRPASRSPQPAPDTAAAAAAGADAATQRLDFSAMTRQQLTDWMNQQIRSGQMTLDESTPLVGMTMKISVATGQPVDMASDGERIDFLDRARQGVAGALSRHDHAEADSLRDALVLMLRHQGTAAGIDARA